MDVGEVWIDEEDLPSDEISTYEDGYNDAMTEINKDKCTFIEQNSCLLQKIERLAYGFGK